LRAEGEAIHGKANRPSRKLNRRLDTVLGRAEEAAAVRARYCIEQGRAKA
jgi:hypothetical protein